MSSRLSVSSICFCTSKALSDKFLCHSELYRFFTLFSLIASIASLWEIAIKIELGKLDIQRPFENLETDLQRLDIKILPIAFSDVQIYRALPLHHRDPFDRILIAQSISNNLMIITRDALFKPYLVELMW